MTTRKRQTRNGVGATPLGWPRNGADIAGRFPILDTIWGQDNMSSAKAAHFYKFDPESPLPFFPRLLAECPAKVDTAYDEEEPSWAVESLSPIRKVCEEFDFTAILIDLTIFQDERLIPRGQDPYLANYVGCYRDFKDGRVLKAYDAALEIMQNDAIVPHPKFYEYLYLTTAMPQVTDRVPQTTFKSSAFRRRTIYKPFRGLLRDTVEKQLKRLRKHFEARLDDSTELLGGSFLMAIPYHRAPYQPSLHFRPRNHQGAAGIWDAAGPQAASPGGGLFLVLEPRNATTPLEHRVERLACSLQCMLTKATLAEAASNVGIQMDVVDKLSSLVHGSVNAIRSIRAADLCRAVAYNVPPRSIADFRSEALRNDISTANNLLLALNQAMLGEDTAAALIAFTEMNLNPDLVRAKFKNLKSVSFRQLLSETQTMMTGVATGSRGQTYAPIKLELRESGRRRAGGEEWLIPEGYLDANFIRGLLLEIARNASMYGKPSKDGAVHVRCRVRPARSGGMICHFANDLDSAATRDSAVGGFLLRMSRVLERLSGLKLELPTSFPRKTYDVTLLLGELNVEVDRERFQRIAPHWQAQVKRET